VVQVATDTAEGLADLLAAQIKLAHLELSLDLRLALKRVARIALFIPPLIVGYGFAMAALSSFLASYWGRLAALGSVAGLQIAVAGIGLQRTLSALRRTPILERTSADLTGGVQRTMAALSDRTRSSDVRIA
jgi:Putative Actinobacterial Holin-X, holin superfamily III